MLCVVSEKTRAATLTTVARLSETNGISRSGLLRLMGPHPLRADFSRRTSYGSAAD